MFAAHSPPGDTRRPALCRVRVKGKNVLLEPQPSLLTLRRQGSVLVRVIHRYYAARCDSSQTYTRAVWPEPSPADLPPGLLAGVSELSRFSCMKFLGVLGGLRLRRTEQALALASLRMWPSARSRASASGLHLFGAQLPTPPIPLFTLRPAPRDAWRKTRGRVDR